MDNRSDVSSSQMEDGDVTLIFHEDNLELIEQIENRLSATYKVLRHQCIAGRSEVLNQMSRVHHAKFKIILMSDEHGEKLGRLIQSVKPEHLLGCTTLVLYENKEPTTQLLRGQIRVQVPKMDVNETAKAVTRFIEAHREAENEAKGRDDEKTNLYISLLCGSFIYSDPLLMKPRDDVLTRFEEKFGGFQLKQSSSFKEFSNHSYILEVRNKALRFSKNGRLVYTSWASRVADKLSLQDLHRQGPKLKSMEWLENQSQLIGSRTKKEKESIQNMRTTLQMLEGSETGFFLISDIQNTPGDLSGIAHVPWMRVFDFDVNSRECGLLNQVQGQMSENAELKILPFSDSISTLHESTTDWLFMKGMHEDPKSVHTGEFMDWISEHEERLNTTFREMADYCCPDLKPMFVVLWYNTDEESYDYLEEMLGRIRKGFSNGQKTHSFPVNMWVCTSKPNVALEKILKKYKVLNQIMMISLSDINDCLGQMTPPNTAPKGLQLPGKDDNGITTTIHIEREAIRRINHTLEILPMDHVLTEDLAKERGDEMYGKSFLRGGEITWDHLSFGNIAIDRNAQEAACDHIRWLINNRWSSTVVELHHSPGGGGSTFARQLLWKLRRDAPCISVKTPIVSISEVLSHLKEIYELTKMPVIVVLDGGSESDVQTLLTQRGIELMILHVLRNYESVGQFSPTENLLKLPSFVSTVEAFNLSKILSNFSPSSQDALENLKKEAVKSFNVQLYEFGLTAFSLEYEGIKSYILGYMAPPETPLLSWQKTVAFLSLLLYYGQVGISKNTFRNLLGVSPKSVQLNDLPFKGLQFITESNRGEWKMIYPRVAKEVLEYVLVSPEAYGEQPIKERLSATARKELPNLVIDFIKSVKAEVGSLSPPSIVIPLTKMIIRRGREPKRQTYSRLLDDVNSEGGRPKIIAIVETLAETFPNNSEILAYLGKQYSYARQFDKAEENLQRAVDLARKGSGDDVTGRTHNTFGYSYHKHVNQLVREEDIPNALLFCQKGIDQFRQASKLVANNFSYGYLGEIKIRLLMAEYVHNEIPGRCQASIDGTLDIRDVGLAEMVRESFYECHRLLKECQSSTKPSELKEIEDYSKCKNTYNMCYNNARPTSVVFKPENIHQNLPTARRIITHKLNLIKTASYESPYDLATLVKEVVHMYDVMLRGIFSKGVRTGVSVDMRSWLSFMRYADAEDTHDIASMVKVIEAWMARKEKWGNAPVYLYVCRFLLAIYSDDSVAKRRENLIESTRLRDSFRSGRIAYYDKTVELLGSHKPLTMKKLIPQEELGDWDDSKKMWSKKEAISMLQVWTGSILKTKHASPSVGWISVELKNPIERKTVDVYFNPKKYNLHARSIAEKRQRVEFFLGFHTYNGAEAHCVRPLKQLRCPNCQFYCDIITLKDTSDVMCKSCLRSLPVRI